MQIIEYMGAMIILKACDKEVGQLIDNKKGSILFKYSDENFLEFSPIKIRIGNKSVQNFSHIKYQYGLPGLISDNLPGVKRSAKLGS